jgi:hypothetical protein
MIEFKLNRFKIDLRGVLGEITCGTEHVCWTLERPWEMNRKYVSCIPCGKYETEKWWDSRRDSYVFWLKNVPARSEILIHPGNKIADSKGCIIPGLEYDIYTDYFIVENSRDSIDALNICLGNFNKCLLNIIDESKKTKWSITANIMEARIKNDETHIEIPEHPIKPTTTLVKEPFHRVKSDIPFYRQDGFKTRFGFILTGVGYLVEAFGLPIGTGIKYLGMGVGAVGVGHSVTKSSPKHNDNKGLWQYIKELILYLFNLLRFKLKEGSK